MAFLITTTGLGPNPIILKDLGAISISHPTNLYNLENRTDKQSIYKSDDLKQAIALSYLIATNENGDLITDSSFPYASQIPVKPTGGLSSSTVQDALEELQSEIGTGGPSTTTLSLIEEVVALELIPAFSVCTMDGRVGDSTIISQRAKIAGISKAQINIGFSGEVVRSGLISNPAWSFTPMSPVFLNGQSLSHTFPTSGYSLYLGTAKSATSLILNFNYGILKG